MSRSGYSDDCEQWSLIRWRGAVASSIRGKRGQAFLREMLAALDAMPDKRLIKDELAEPGHIDLGHWGLHEGPPLVCALGSVGVARGLDMSEIDPEDRESVASAFGIPHALACEIMYENDEVAGGYWPQPWNGHFDHIRRYWVNRREEHRWHAMRGWVASKIKVSP